MEAQTDFDWMTPLTGVLAAAGGYVVRIIFDRKKVKAENDTAQLDADTKAVELYERFAAQLNPKIESLQAKQDELITQVTALKVENAELKIENMGLRTEIDRLKSENVDLHNQVSNLKKQMS